MPLGVNYVDNMSRLWVAPGLPFDTVIRVSKMRVLLRRYYTAAVASQALEICRISRPFAVTHRVIPPVQLTVSFAVALLLLFSFRSA